MVRGTRLTPGLVMALHTLVGAGLALAVVRAGGPDLPLHLLVAPVLVASVFFPRWVYLAMAAVSAGLSIAVVYALYHRPTTSLKTIAAVVVTMVVVAELLRHLVGGRLAAEERLRETTEKLEALIGAAPLAVCALDLRGRVQSWNPAAERLFGWSEAEALHQVLPVIPEERDSEYAALRDRVLRGETLSEVETVCRHRDGRELSVGVYAAPLRDRGGRVRGILAMLADIAARRQAEESSRRLLVEQAARAEAERSDRAKDAFLAVLSHELRNPLSAIASAAHLLAAVPPDHPRAVHAREVISRQSRQLSRLVEDLLDVARITQGKVTLRREVTDLAECARRALESTRPTMDEHRHQVEVKLPPRLLVDADPVRLEQVISNLLLNAAKYTDAGGRIALEVGEDPGVPASALVRVRDTGVGIPLEFIPRIFELFSQAESAVERSRGGLGIGLTLVRDLVELHGGRVEARSDGPGRGTEFTVYLPLATGRETSVPALPSEPDSSRGAAPAAPLPPGPLSPLPVLVVDDNVDAAETLAELLGLWGCEPRLAHDGPAAIAAADLEPAVVILDIGLPGMDGYEVARRLRSREWSRRPLLIALTGFGQDADRRRAAEAGFDEHFTKPVDAEGLRKLLAAVPRHDPSPAVTAPAPRR